MFENGAVPTLAPLLRNFPDDLEIQALLVMFLTNIYQDIKKSHEILEKLGVIPFLLKACYLTSKGISFCN